ncbi:MAG: Ku protein [Dehalococcoidia bacterium]|nr:Ku protein [Dehalococcoidia bacterium]
MAGHAESKAGPPPAVRGGVGEYPPLGGRPDRERWVMARPIWRGAISFGMVSIPVKLYGATDAKDVSFNLLHKKCHARIKQQRYCPIDEQVIEWGDVVKGYEFSKDQYVIMEDAGFDRVPVNSTRAIEVTSFVGLADIDPQYYERSFYLEPEEVGKKPYVLLRRALQDTNRAAVAKVSLRQKEQLCLLRPKDSVLIMQTMFYPDELRATGELTIPSDEEVPIAERELTMAHSLVDILTAEFEPGQYHDEYREALLALIERKVNGEAAISAPPVAPGKVVDLMEALRASIAEAKKERAVKPLKSVPAPDDEAETAKPARRRRVG